ncbi:MAG: DUF3606 domain-containing protein [Spirochaetia bacterium]|nr:DUF3606 domain-containing protein [Spirochaetia bacterium]
MPNATITMLMKTTNHVNFNDPEQVSAWSAKYGCTAADLRNAVTLFGDSEETLKNFFDKCFDPGLV